MTLIFSIFTIFVLTIFFGPSNIFFSDTKNPTSADIFPTSTASINSSTSKTPKESPIKKSEPIVQKNPQNSNPPKTTNRSENSSIRVSAILELTNKERKQRQLQSLIENKTLRVLAERRLNDMVENNYFAHTSPTGESVVTLSKIYGYEYSVIGENIARGDFKDSEQVVEGWMNSPGHRANILSNDYVEIGIAAEFVNFGGRKQWVAVQVFGKSL